MWFFPERLVAAGDALRAQRSCTDAASQEWRIGACGHRPAGPRHTPGDWSVLLECSTEMPPAADLAFDFLQEAEHLFPCGVGAHKTCNRAPPRHRCLLSVGYAPRQLSATSARPRHQVDFIVPTHPATIPDVCACCHRRGAARSLTSSSPYASEGVPWPDRAAGEIGGSRNPDALMTRVVPGCGLFQKIELPRLWAHAHLSHLQLCNLPALLRALALSGPAFLAFALPRASYPAGLGQAWNAFHFSFKLRFHGNIPDALSRGRYNVARGGDKGLLNGASPESEKPGHPSNGDRALLPPPFGRDGGPRQYSSRSRNTLRASEPLVSPLTSRR